MSIASLKWPYVVCPAANCFEGVRACERVFMWKFGASCFAPRALVLAGIVVLEAVQSRRMFSVAVIASAAQLPSTDRSAQFSIGLLCLQICLCSTEVLGFRVGASPFARRRVCVCVVNQEAPQLFLGNNMSLQMGAEERVNEENHHNSCRGKQGKKQREGRTHIIRVRVIRENWTLWLMSVIREQIFQALAALQTGSISCH